eukprot:11176353-Lingulodinium_polyedra.AAC.1
MGNPLGVPVCCCPNNCQQTATNWDMNSSDTTGWAPVWDRPSPSGSSLGSQNHVWWRLVVNTTCPDTNVVATP